MNNQINENTINYDNQLAWWVKWIVEFNNFSLTSLCNNETWYLIQTWNEFSRTNIDLWEFTSSLIDWGWVYSKKYWNQTITFNLFIQWENHADLINKIDNLKWALQWINWDLDIKVNNEIRTYTATCESVDIPSIKRSNDFIENVRVSFLITSWVWKLKNRTENFLANQSANFEMIISNTWNYETFPIFYLITKSGTNLQEIEIIIKDIWETSWNPLSITEQITDTNIIIVDYNSKTITIDWNEVAYFGFMTPLKTWLNAIEFNFTWTFELDAYVLYNKKFI